MPAAPLGPKRIFSKFRWRTPLRMLTTITSSSMNTPRQMDMTSRSSTLLTVPMPAKVVSSMILKPGMSSSKPNTEP